MANQLMPLDGWLTIISYSWFRSHKDDLFDCGTGVGISTRKAMSFTVDLILSC